MTIKKKENKVDLFEVLNKLSTADINFFDNLSESDKKSLAPIVVMRWLTGTYDKQQIQFINHFVNPFVFSLYSHLDLQFKLMMASCTGITKRYKWLKKEQSKKLTKELEIIMQYCDVGYREAKQYYSLLNNDDIDSMKAELGIE